MSWLCEFVGLSMSPEQRDALLEICKEIEPKIARRTFLTFGDSKRDILRKKYKELETCVLQHDVIDWKQVEGKLRQMLLEYGSAASDEWRFGIKSITWLKVFRTHGSSMSPEQRDALLEICKEIELMIARRTFLTFGDSKRDILRKKYKELETCVPQHDVIDWKQVEGKLRQTLLEYGSAVSDEWGFGIKSITWLKVFRTHGSSMSLEQRYALLEICKEIEVKITRDRFCIPTSLAFEDSKKGVLHKKYKEIETWVLQHDVKNWKQVEGKLRQMLLEYDSAESDELRFGIKSMTWLKIFRTHERSIPEPIRNCLYEMCKEIEEGLYMWGQLSLNTIEAFNRRYKTLGHGVLEMVNTIEAFNRRYKTLRHGVLEMEIVDWEDIRKSFRQIFDDWKRGLGHQGITFEDLDGKQQIIYHRLTFKNDLDYLVNQVVEKTGIPKEEFVLVYEESLIDQENKDFYIPDGAELQFLPLKKELANQSIIVEDLDGQQHIINTNWVTYTNDVDYLVRQVAHTAGISKRRFVLVYREKLIVPGKHFYIPNGAKIQLLPVKKNQNPPTDLTTYVRGLFNGIYGQIHRLFTYFSKVFEDTTRLLLEKDFVRISQLIGEGWGLLGIELGLSKVKLQQITEDKQNVVSRIFEMLSQWSQTRKDGATAGQLLSAVMKSGVCCDFNELKRVLLVGL